MLSDFSWAFHFHHRMGLIFLFLRFRFSSRDLWNQWGSAWRLFIASGTYRLVLERKSCALDMEMEAKRMWDKKGKECPNIAYIWDKGNTLMKGLPLTHIYLLPTDEILLGES
jgi:hypothetical protein